MEYLALKVPTKYQLRAPGFSCYVFPGTRGPGHEDSRSPRGKDLRRRWPECTPRIVFKNCTATTVLYWNFSSLPQPRPLYFSAIIDGPGRFTSIDKVVYIVHRLTESLVCFSIFPRLPRYIRILVRWALHENNATINMGEG